MKYNFKTEIDFELPRGYIDDGGELHRRGRMRLATAADEILPLRDPRVQQNEAYVTVIILARVITQLGNLCDIHTGIIEGLFASDLAYLQRLYEQFNSTDPLDQSSQPSNKKPSDESTLERSSGQEIVRGNGVVEGSGAVGLRRLSTVGEA